MSNTSADAVNEASMRLKADTGTSTAFENAMDTFERGYHFVTHGSCFKGTGIVAVTLWSSPEDLLHCVTVLL